MCLRPHSRGFVLLPSIKQITIKTSLWLHCIQEPRNEETEEGDQQTGVPGAEEQADSANAYRGANPQAEHQHEPGSEQPNDNTKQTENPAADSASAQTSLKDQV